MATDTTRKKKTRSVPVSLVEFTAAAHEHVEPAFDQSQILTAAQQNLNPFDIPAYGYVRHIILLVEASGGTLGPGVFAADAPFNVLKEVAFFDVNGVAICQLSGYDLFLANLFGGYAFRNDPRNDPDYATGINFAFALRIPIEILHNNGLGALANQNAAASYKVRVALAPSGEVFSTAPTTLPTVRVRGVLEAWSQPNPTDLAGRPQALVPPRHGTTQYWTATNKQFGAAGRGSVPITRVGNLLRNLIFVARDATGARTNSVFPDDAVLSWDSRQQLQLTRFLARKYASERNIVVDVPAGVFPFQFTHDLMGKAGDGTPELWWPTVQSTRLELAGTFGAGRIDTLVNDVAPVEVTPAERFMERSETGFTPDAVGVVAAGG